MDDKKQKINKSKHSKNGVSSCSINVSNKDDINKEKNKFNFKSIEKKCETLYKNMKNIFHNNKENKSKTSINSDTTNNLNNQPTEVSIDTGRTVSNFCLFDNIPKSTSMIHLNASNQQNEPERETNNQNGISSNTKNSSCATSIPNILFNDKMQPTNRKCLNIEEFKAKLLLLSPEERLDLQRKAYEMLSVQINSKQNEFIQLKYDINELSKALSKHDQIRTNFEIEKLNDEIRQLTNEKAKIENEIIRQSNWQCPKCNKTNLNHTFSCNWCSYEKDSDEFVLCKQCESKNSLNNSLCTRCSSFLEEDNSRFNTANSNTSLNLNQQHQHHPVSYPAFGTSNNLSYSPSTMPNSNYLSAYQSSQSFAGHSNVTNLQSQNKMTNGHAHSTAKRN